ncbi:hypothetical protein TRIUR3_16575 [Triticum urartu]|uniref:Uncharacterized protein n=3 Tax=Triticum TaxID=4564 RepID=A0A9R0RTL6_TRITD|nr:hypothetical protein TRIUR3_16575 [Triticum urartu]VAH65952.1 unnamed protein product [Triticum turgidum subsp. durum]
MPPARAPAASPAIVTAMSNSIAGNTLLAIFVLLEAGNLEWSYYAGEGSWSAQRRRKLTGHAPLDEDSSRRMSGAGIRGLIIVAIRAVGGTSSMIFAHDGAG